MNHKETSLIPSQEELNLSQVMAKKATDSQLFAKIGGEAGLLSIMLMARELGIPAFQAIMGGMNVIQGKVEISPRLMNSMIRKAGHKIVIIESTDVICKLNGIRHDTQEDYLAIFSIDDAKRAGLVRSGGGWEKYPSDMLFARCISKLARRLFADVISTAYVEGEISNPEGNAEAPQKSINEEELHQQTETIEIVEKTEPKMGSEEFIAKLREKVGGKYSLLGMQEYILKLESEKGVPSHKIMEQALNPALIERFCRGWKQWDEQKTQEGQEEKS